MQNRAITFIKYYQPYNAGETAGFPPNVAQKLVDAGYATYHEKKSSEPEQNRAITETAPKKRATKKK